MYSSVMCECVCVCVHVASLPTRRHVFSPQVGEIYAWVEANYPFYKGGSPFWKVWFSFGYEG